MESNQYGLDPFESDRYEPNHYEPTTTSQTTTRAQLLFSSYPVGHSHELRRARIGTTNDNIRD